MGSGVEGGVEGGRCGRREVWGAVWREGSEGGGRCGERAVWREGQVCFASGWYWANVLLLIKLVAVKWLSLATLEKRLL